MKGRSRLMSQFSRIRVAGVVLAISSVFLAGCSAASSGGTDGKSDAPKANKKGNLTIAYLQKQGDQQYFVDEAQGAKDKAKELGVTLKVIDLGTDANKAISELNAVIAQGVDGIAIVVPDPQIGPQVISAAKDAGVPLIASDDAIAGGDGTPAPFVGFDGKKMGEEVGTKAAELFKSSGWKLQDTGVIEAWKQDLQTCSDRVAGAEDAFKQATGGKLP